jgi:hypothetical protein
MCIHTMCAARTTVATVATAATALRVDASPARRGFGAGGVQEAGDRVRAQAVAVEGDRLARPAVAPPIAARAICGAGGREQGASGGSTHEQREHTPGLAGAVNARSSPRHGFVPAASGRGELDATRSRPGRKKTKCARRRGAVRVAAALSRTPSPAAVTRVRCSVRRAHPRQKGTPRIANGRTGGTAALPAAQLKPLEAVDGCTGEVAQVGEDARALIGEATLD